MKRDKRLNQLVLYCPLGLDDLSLSLHELLLGCLIEGLLRIQPRHLNLRALTLSRAILKVVLGGQMLIKQWVLVALSYGLLLLRLLNGLEHESFLRFLEAARAPGRPQAGVTEYTRALVALLE